MSALRIAFISPFFPLKGGIARFSELFRSALCQKGYDVVPVAFRALYPNFLMNSAFDGSCDSEKCRLPESRLLLYNPFTWLATLRSIRLMKPNILLVAYWTGFLAPFCYVLHRLTGIRVVVLLHNFTSHDSFFFEPIMQRVLVASSCEFLTLSSVVSKELLTVAPNSRVLQLFHPLYEPEKGRPSRADARRTLQLDASAPVLLFFGYVRPYKGLDMLLKALPEILRKERMLKLVIAGEFYENLAIYQDMIWKLGISVSVDLYPGYVSPERSALFFCAADAVVLPYRSATQSGVLQQAYGYALPVLVTPEGALPDVVRHGSTGWIAPETSAPGLVAVVGEFLDGRNKLPAMRSAIAELGREFSWETFAVAAARFLEAEAGEQ
ncbi:MAG: glycosyltransferase [Chlorobiaceae bacterium]